MCPWVVSRVGSQPRRHGSNRSRTKPGWFRRRPQGARLMFDHQLQRLNFDHQTMRLNFDHEVWPIRLKFDQWVRRARGRWPSPGGCTCWTRTGSPNAASFCAHTKTQISVWFDTNGRSHLRLQNGSGQEVLAESWHTHKLNTASFCAHAKQKHRIDASREGRKRDECSWVQMQM